MTGPHQAIICSLTGIGQGAAACTAERIEETSYLARTSAGSFSIRTKWVGTNWPTSTLYFSMRPRASSGSNFSITTTVPPRRWTLMHQRSGAA